MGSATSHIGTVIRMRRNAKGMTQWDLAKSAGLSLKTVEMIERGESKPRRSTLTVIDLALGKEEAA